MQSLPLNPVFKKYLILVIILTGLIILSFFILVINKGQVKSSIKNQAPIVDEDKKSNSFNVGSSSKNEPIKPLSGSTLLPKGAYNDGTYTGFSSTPSGVLVVKIIIQTGHLTNITFITTPKGDNADALDTLAQEAIQKQIVEVSPVNAYYDISTAFNKALSDAIKKSFKI